MQARPLVRAAVVLPAVLILGLAVVSADEPYRENVNMSYPLSSNGRVSLDNVNGDLRVEVWDREEIRIEAVKQASSARALEDLEVVVDASAASVRIETEYPRRSHGGQRVDYTLTVPRQVAIDSFDLVNGSMEIVGVEGDIKAQSVNGTITTRAVGALELSTVNGAIEAHAEVLTAGDRLELESVNGRINVYVGAGVGAEVRAETVNGKIRNEFDLEVRKHKYVGADMRGTIGSGGAKIEISTVNGAISVRGE